MLLRQVTQVTLSQAVRSLKVAVWETEMNDVSFASFALAQVAQSVEQRTENPCVGGSIPSLGTIKQVLVSGVRCQGPTPSRPPNTSHRTPNTCS